MLEMKNKIYVHLMGKSFLTIRITEESIKKIKRKDQLKKLNDKYITCKPISVLTRFNLIRIENTTKANYIP